MYNRYIGNTGKVVRMQDAADRFGHTNRHGHKHEYEHDNRHEEKHGHKSEHGHEHDCGPHSGAHIPPPHSHKDLQEKQKYPKKPFLFGGSALKAIDSALPFGLETSDLILLVLFLFLFIESGDEEFLVILGFLAYSFFKDSKADPVC